MEETRALTWSPRAPEQVLAELLPPDEARLEASNLAADLPAIRARFGEDATSARANLSQITSMLRASEADAERLAGQSYFRSVWQRLTGQAPRDVAEIRNRLTQVQARAVAVTEQLLSREAYLAQATRYLGARVELLALDNVALKAALVRLGERVMDRVEQVEDRVERLERETDGMARRIALIELFQSAFSPSRHRAYLDLGDPVERALVLCRDFEKATGGAWRPIDFHRLSRLAKSEAGLSDSPSLSLDDLVERGLALAENELLDWLGGEGMAERLLAPMDEGASEVRSFFPIHFILLRPRWFVRQGLPASAVRVVADEIRAQGLDPGERLSPWALARLLLEERLAFALERGDKAIDGPVVPAALPARVDRGAATLATVSTGGMVVERLFLISGEILALGWLPNSTRLSLVHLTARGPMRVLNQPAWPDAGRQPWAPGGSHLWTLSVDRRGLDGLTYDPSSDARPWVWSGATLPSGPPLAGLSSRGTGLAAWRLTQLLMRDGTGRLEEQPFPRRIADAAVGDDGIFVLDEQEVYRCWPARGLRPWVRLGEGLTGKRILAAPGARAFVHATDRHGGEVVLGLDGAAEPVRQYFELPIEGLAPLNNGRVLVRTQDGRLQRFAPQEKVKLASVEPAGLSRVALLADDGHGRVAALADGEVIVFAVT